MPQIKSAKKRHRQSLKRRARNMSVRTTLKSHVRQLNGAIEDKEIEKAREWMRKTEAAFDKAASKGVIHKKTSSRKISRFKKRVHQLSEELQQPDSEQTAS